MKKFTSIVIGSATGDSQIHFRKTSFLTESNREHIENCVRTFLTFPIPLAFSDLVKMTCCLKKDIPEVLLKDLQLNPELIPDKTWNTFVNELRYQYKITHPTFMTEFTVPHQCMAAYDALISVTSEVAAYMFYKKANTFLYDHIKSSIGQQHISDTFNRLTWHSRDDDMNRLQKIKGLRRLSLRDYEANYFYNHLEKCLALLQSIQDYMKLDEQSSAMKPAAKEVANDDDLPFFFGDSTLPVTTQSAEKSYLELSFENVLAYETDFLDFISNNDEACYNRLHAAGFDMDRVRDKIFAIYRVLYTHSEMTKAIADLNK